MRYTNIATGAIIDSPFVINGDDWKVLEVEQVSEAVEEIEVENTETTDEEYVDEEIDLNKLTNDQLEKLAKDQNIKLTAGDKKNKDTRIAAIVAGLE